MAQMLSPNGFGGRRGSIPPSPAVTERPSSYVAWIGRADGPEPPLVVEFSGLSEDEQRAAISGFPGGRRFILAGLTH